jgi:hypothetical protein
MAYLFFNTHRSLKPVRNVELRFKTVGTFSCDAHII